MGHLQLTKANKVNFGFVSQKKEGYAKGESVNLKRFFFTFQKNFALYLFSKLVSRVFIFKNRI